MPRHGRFPAGKSSWPPGISLDDRGAFDVSRCGCLRRGDDTPLLAVRCLKPQLPFVTALF